MSKCDVPKAWTFFWVDFTRYCSVRERNVSLINKEGSKG